MGLTIHYKLQCDTRDDDKVRRHVEELRKRALDLPFAKVGEVAELDGDRCDYRDYDGNDPLRWLAVQAGQHVERDGTYYRVQPNAVVVFTTWPGDLADEEAGFGVILIDPECPLEVFKCRVEIVLVVISLAPAQ